MPLSSSSSSRNQAQQILVLCLKRAENVTWKEGTVDSEFLNCKSSKKCCIFHKEKPFDEDATATEAATVVAISLFVFISLLTFLASPLVDHPVFPSRPNRHLSHSRLLLKNPVELQKNVVLTESYSVPSGGIVGDDLWTSKLEKDFNGCSNPGREFKKAQAITGPEKYLMIATSGGLNQQRTGVSEEPPLWKGVHSRGDLLNPNEKNPQ